jgi:hypothetical protein
VQDPCLRNKQERQLEQLTTSYHSICIRFNE